MTNSQQVQTMANANDSDIVPGSWQDNSDGVAQSEIRLCLEEKNTATAPREGEMEQAFNAEKRVPFPRGQ